MRISGKAPVTVGDRRGAIAVLFALLLVPLLGLALLSQFIGVVIMVRMVKFKI